MRELSVIVEQTQGLVTANFEEVKNQLYLSIVEYRGLTYTEDTALQAKTDIATLRKLKKAIDDKRKEVKKAQMIPYEVFEEKAKELIAIIDEAISPIEEQISEFEDKRRADRKAGIFKYFTTISGDVSDIASFDEVFTEKMLNATTTQKSIKETLDTYIESIKRDIETIKSMNSDAVEKALGEYGKTKNLNAAIKLITDFERQKAEIIARREAEERDKKEREEKERLAQVEREKEEAQRIETERINEAINKAKAEERKKIERELEIQKAKDEEERRIREESERIEREKREEAERIARIEAERIAEEKRAEEQAAFEAEEKRIAEERKKNQKYFIRVIGLKRKEIDALADYLKANNYSFESGLQ